jgi:hypothetical protein
MVPPRHSSLVLLAVSAWMTAMAGCYRPSIGDGTLACAAHGVCPRGFHCETQLCRQNTGAGQEDAASGDAGLPSADTAAEVAGTDASPCGVATPSSFGRECGSCGGKILCDGSCSVESPVALGQACGGCGGKVLCDGSCSFVDPPSYSDSCGGCGGRVRCDGSCDIPTPTNFGVACGACGGTIQCNGTCSVADPPGLNSACGSCGGKIQCGGQCSVATPADYGAIDTEQITDNFACCFIDEARSYGPAGRNMTGCFAGYSYAGCTVAKQSGGGSVSVVSEDAATCTCRLHINNVGLEGATYVVSIRQIRGC